MESTSDLSLEQIKERMALRQRLQEIAPILRKETVNWEDKSKKKEPIGTKPKRLNVNHALG